MLAELEQLLAPNTSANYPVAIRSSISYNLQTETVLTEIKQHLTPIREIADYHPKYIESLFYAVNSIITIGQGKISLTEEKNEYDNIGFMAFNMMEDISDQKQYPLIEYLYSIGQ